jgi:hypothetical protein
MINTASIRGTNNNSHVWNFSRVGGVNRVNLETGLDLMFLDQLDQKLWTALSCPVYGLEIDSKTLELIDTDKDERIRVPEIIAAVRWVTSLIKNPDELTKDNYRLPLSSLTTETEEGKHLLESARQILENLGTPDATEISVEETSDTTRIFANTRFNGDGIITGDSADNEILKDLIRDIVSCMGSETDRNGKEGISANHIIDFYINCESYSLWYSSMESDPNEILPFGESTSDAFAAFIAIKAKLEDYFLRCRLSEFDPGSSEILNSLTSRFEEIRYKDLSSLKVDIAAFPIAAFQNGNTLSLAKGLNPSWVGAVTRFVKQVLQPLFPGKDTITESDIEEITKIFEPYVMWQSEKKGYEVEKLGLIRIKEILSINSKEDLLTLIDKDKSMEENAKNILQVDKLVRYYRDLFKLLRNYVTFYDFYSPDKEAIFQTGKLFIDQRCCDLCLKVTDLSKHNLLARTSGLCLIYCSCYSSTMNEKMTIVAALTDGDFENIEVGRNGIFYDRKGNDWDATIIKIIDNPISIRQAFWSPYRKASKFISNQIEKVASAREKEVETNAAGSVEKVSGKLDSGMKESLQTNQAAGTGPAKQTAPAQPFDIGKFVGIFAAISIALGAIGSVVMSVLTGFLSLTWWKMPVALLGLVLVLSGPSMIIAWLKLRNRNLAPLLDANGWAINARATINIVFGNTLTHMAALPQNSRLNLVDPFSKKRNPVIPVLIFSIIILAAAGYLLWYFGILSRWGIL